MTWLKDLAFGEEGEGIIKKIIGGEKVDWKEGYDLSYKGKRIEVKRDARARQTGNLCFEDSLIHQGTDYIVFIVEGTTDMYVFTKKECVNEMLKGYKMRFENKKYIYLVNRQLLNKYKKNEEQLKLFFQTI